MKNPPPNQSFAAQTVAALGRQLSADLNALRDAELRAKMRQTPAGKLLVRYGFEPYDTESSARRIAEKAADEIDALKCAIIRHLDPLTYGARSHAALRSLAGLDD